MSPLTVLPLAHDLRGHPVRSSGHSLPRFVALKAKVILQFFRSLMSKCFLKYSSVKVKLKHTQNSKNFNYSMNFNLWDQYLKLQVFLSTSGLGPIIFGISFFLIKMHISFYFQTVSKTASWNTVWKFRRQDQEVRVLKASNIWQAQFSKFYREFCNIQK